MNYALNLDENKRILSACVVLPNSEYGNMPIVGTLPTGETVAEKEVSNWRYSDGVYVYDPLPELEPTEPQPTPEERIAALEKKLAAYEARFAAMESETV